MTMRSRLASVFLAVALAATLGGCSLIEGVIEQQTGQEVELGGTEVPEDFPEEVPLLEGEVILGSVIGSDTQRVWNVIIKVGDGALEQITTQFSDAGFTATPATESEQGSAVTFSKDDLGVLVLVGADQENGTIANYTVTRTS
jgi:hypothetical protein